MHVEIICINNVLEDCGCWISGCLCGTETDAEGGSERIILGHQLCYFVAVRKCFPSLFTLYSNIR